MNTELIDQLRNCDNSYLRKGHHIIKLYTKDSKPSVELRLPDDELTSTDQRRLIENLSSELKSRPYQSKESNFIFNGNIRDASHHESRQWFLNFLDIHSNKITKYFFNKKLAILDGLVNSFLSVFSDVMGLVKYNLEYQLLECSDPSRSNIHCNLIWFDHTIVSGGFDECSTYKIFYTVALGTDQRTVPPGNHSIIETRFISPEMLEKSKTELNNVTKLLKQIQFSDHEIKTIFDLISGLIELSQYQAKGDEKKLEFFGAGHLTKSSEYFMVKEKELRDFLINEYFYIENKRKLKSAEIVNGEINAFIAAIYDVIVNRIFDKYNQFQEMEMLPEKIHTTKFLHMPSLPEFSNEKTFLYQHFYNFYLSTSFQSASASILDKERKVYVKNSSSKNLIPDPTMKKSSEENCLKIFNIISEYKISKNQSDYRSKLEKQDLQTVKFIKIHQKLFVELFILEISSFVRFDWNSLVAGSKMQSLKDIGSFLKICSLSLFQNYHLKRFSGRIWTQDELSMHIKEKFVYDRDAYFVHVLVDEDYQRERKISLMTQINSYNLNLLQFDEIFLPIMGLKEFIDRYSVLFLNYGDNSRKDKESCLHAISRLNLTSAWCCYNYIHLRSDHIEDLESQVAKYHRYVIKLQNYVRRIVAKLKLRNLRIRSLQYKEEYLDALEQSIRFGNRFLEEYRPIVSVDRENADIKLLSSIYPSPMEIDQMKYNDKDNVPWLRVNIMSNTTMLFQGIFPDSKVCLTYSDIIPPDLPNILSINQYIPPEIQSELQNSFALKVTYEPLFGDVLVQVKSKQPLFVWNIETESNRSKRRLLPQSRGELRPSKPYRIFSGNYFIKKMAYNTLNGISYESFQHLVQECSTAIMVQQNPLIENILSKCPLWIVLTNCLPLINLPSTQTFNLVNKQRRIIDRTECSQYVKGMYLRPRNDWLIPNVSTQLLIMNLENRVSSTPRPSVSSLLSQQLNQSTNFSAKQNYKIKKYLQNK